jgi:hypothetical protein
MMPPGMQRMPMNGAGPIVAGQFGAQGPQQMPPNPYQAQMPMQAQPQAMAQPQIPAQQPMMPQNNLRMMAGMR